MPKSNLIRLLRKAYQLAHATQEPSAQEVSDKLRLKHNDNWSRRQFIERSVQAGLAYGGLSLLSGCAIPNLSKSSGGAAKIVVVGAGIAGLHAGFCLKKYGLPSSSLQIFEGSKRIGGRMFTAKLFGNDMTTELGGEFTDSNHFDILNLAKQFGITVLDKKSDEATIEDRYFFDGKFYTVEDIARAVLQCSNKIALDATSLGKDYDTPDCKRLDYLPLKAYLESLETEGWFKKLLEIAYVGEYGLSAEEQSALNLIDLIGVDKKGFKLFGDSDERYKLLGGNQQICERLADNLKDNLHFEHTLISIKNKDQGYTLTFSNGGSTKEVDADYVIMTIPYTVLRDVEGISQLNGISKEKLKCINELGYGENGKIFLGLISRPWRAQDTPYQGYFYSDHIHTSWDSYHLQNQNRGRSTYTVFLGSKPGVNVAPDQAANYVPELNLAFPGFKSAFIPSQTAAMNWIKNPLAKGSYACYKPGQWTEISGKEGEPVGNLFFAGEHCSSNFQGFMNGAAETGRIAAEQIALKLTGNGSHTRRFGV